ncbi:hypothetical protein FHS42_001919 [Streptomyces zagrosensis]|uniref:Uncharacterized protein n=1 Tax=Streptomyces zagrosensis TaxID=1042984 RepID=A0A7W9Q7N6_9ACTN|nr:hypothetical protein [Streptomyces zagrosensis]
MGNFSPGPDFWSLIHPHTGDLPIMSFTELGFDSDLGALVHCEKGPSSSKRCAIALAHAVTPSCVSETSQPLWESCSLICYEPHTMINGSLSVSRP